MEHENRELTRDERELISIFRRLNREGRESLLQQAVMHSHIPQLQRWWKSGERITYIHQDERREN